MAYRCDCGGVPSPGREKLGAAEGFAKVIKKETGAAPLSCPWRAVESPLVQDVYAVRAMAKAGVPVPEITSRLAHAVGTYEGAHSAAFAERSEREREARRNER